MGGIPLRPDGSQGWGAGKWREDAHLAFAQNAFNEKSVSRDRGRGREGGRVRNVVGTGGGWDREQQ